MAINKTSSPIQHKLSEEILKAAAVPTQNGVATKYWLELISLPAGHNNRLWLFVNSTWTHLDNSTTGQQADVQQSFYNGSNMEVAVWYDNSNTIVGLVVRTL